MGALDGLLVVALEQAVAAPFCSSRLCDAGARVIKVERPEGDFARGYDEFAGGESSYFTWLNQGKESVVLDLRNRRDADLMKRMLARADVFVQNLAPGAVDRLGFSDSQLAALNPGLIRCHISGYGLQGDDPEATLKAYDFLVQAEAGLVSLSGAAGHPGRIGVSVCDIGTGQAAHAAILEALIGRGATGMGRAINLSLFATMADWMAVPLMQFAATGKGPDPVGLAHPTIAPYEGFKTRDGQTILIAIQNDREWVRFCKAVLDAPEAAVDPRFAHNTDRVANRDAMRRLIDARFCALTTADAMTVLSEANIAYGRVNDVAGVAGHPALHTRNLINSLGKTVRAAALPGRSAGEPLSRPAPKLGQHTQDLFREFGPPDPSPDPN